MKKTYAIVLALCVVILFAGVHCGSETTEIAWVNGTAGEGISDIVWFNSNDDSPNQQWSENLTAAGKETSSKEVTKLTGYALCVSTTNGAEARIYVDANGDKLVENIWSADEGSSNRYSINKTEPK